MGGQFQGKRVKADKEAQGEFDSERPGNCGAQDTFDVGTLKGWDGSISRPSSTLCQSGLCQAL